jgi:apolipoprotein D and lipocalin family protein
MSLPLARRGALALLLGALAGCGVARAPQPGAAALRDPAAPLASQADASAARLAGSWVVVQAAGGVAPGSAVTVSGDSLTLDGRRLPLEDLGRGRLRLGGAPLWVHWLDFDNRTAALGAPDGSRVWVMDRSGAPAERLSAAREILDWYGYDLSRLRGPV